MTDWSLNVMPGTPVRRGGKRPSPKLNLRWWKSTLIVACRYSSVIIVQCPGGMAPCLVCLSLAISITKGKRQRAELWLMPGRTDWFWLSVRVCEMVLQVRVCPNFNTGARGTSHIAVAASVTTIKLLAKTQMKDNHVAAGNLKYGTPPPPSASVVHNVRTPNGRTTLDFLHFPIRRRYSILDLRSGSFLLNSSEAVRDAATEVACTQRRLLICSLTHHTRLMRLRWCLRTKAVLQCEWKDEQSRRNNCESCWSCCWSSRSKSRVTFLFTQSFGGCRSESPSSSSHGYCLD